MVDIQLMPLVCEKGKIVVNKSIDRGYKINTLKLEKLLLLINGYMLETNQKQFFETPIQISKDGLRIPIIYKNFVANGIEFKEKFIEYVSLLDLEEEVVDMVLDCYGHLDSFELEELTPLKQITSSFAYTKEEEIPSSIFCGMFEKATEQKKTTAKKMVKSKSL